MNKFVYFMVVGLAFTAFQVSTVAADMDCADPTNASMPECGGGVDYQAARDAEDSSRQATRDAEDNALEAVRNQEDSDRQAAAEAQAATPGMPSQADGFCMTEDACAAAAEDAGANVG